MNTVWVIASALLCGAALICLARLLMGPNTLDRLISVDAMVAISMCGLGVWAAYSHDTTVVPVIVALALVGFVGSLAVARFRVRDDDNGPIITPGQTHDSDPARPEES